MYAILRHKPVKRILYSCYDHVQALEEHVGEDLFDVVLCNENNEGELGPNSQWVLLDDKSSKDKRYYYADLAEDEHPGRHDSAKLGACSHGSFLRAHRAFKRLNFHP